MKNIIFLILIVFCFCTAKAQDTSQQKPNKQKITSDTIRTGHPQRRGVGNMSAPDRKRIDYFRDTIRRERRKFDSTLFEKSNTRSASDYAEELGSVYQILSKIPGTTGSFVKLQSIHEFMDQGDSTLDLLKERMYQSDRSFNIRNLQMFNTLLDELDNNTEYYSRYLRQYDTAMNGIKKEIAALQKDTLMLQIFRDSSLKNNFEPQLQQLKVKWRQVDSLVAQNGKEINTLKSQASAHKITIGELLYRVDLELKTGGSEAFGKERSYLWEANTFDEDHLENSFKESIGNELQLAGIYFSFTGNKWIWLPIISFVFFLWVWWNYRFLKRLNKLEVIEPLQISLINSHPVTASLIFVLSLAPFFDLHAPSIYIETIQLLQMIVLSIILWRYKNRSLFYGWCIFMLLFLMLFLTRILGLSLNLKRWVDFFIDSAAFAFSLFFLLRHRKNYEKWVSVTIGLYSLLNFLAVISNLFGRVTFSQILGYAAAYTFSQTVSLGIFVKIVVEAFMLQIQASRTRKKYPKDFDYATISKSILRFSMIVAVPLWLIVFATNLNLFDALTDLILNIFTSTRQVGNFSFTIGGFVLFVGIIWLANFLQKYIAYFFGDIGDDSAFDDKGQRSRLMVTRLILLIAGFLLAVAASGLAVDRITVILGALGVGIGLGLQSIVNNFVSGIILIFDRPLRIGDIVELGDKKGRVKEIGIRTSTLVTDEGAQVIIPNGDVLSRNIINWTLSNNHIRETLSFTMDKPSLMEDVGIDAIREIVLKNENVLKERPPEITLTNINSKTIELKVFFWTRDFNKSAVISNDIKMAIYKYLESKGITVL
ncbi:MAG TPA: mechanosensitive ion channel domain-containing protein [Puia sp.]|jgi:potassium efflux system protein|nr:mechanosensitive ion channel domain-containing protein [Puia sp.]